MAPLSAVERGREREMGAHQVGVRGKGLEPWICGSVV